MPMIARILVLGIVLALAACGGGQRSSGDGNATVDDTSAALPKPQASGGPVTGMPDKPGPGLVGAPQPGRSTLDTLPPTTSIASDDAVMATPRIADDTMSAVQPPAPGAAASGANDRASPPGEPAAQDAVAVLRDYYAAIAARDYARAYALWSDNGRSSGQTPQQFASGFADTAGVWVQTDAPGRIDAAAGSRYVEVPVTVSATQRDGSVRSYTGSYTLRRAVADGASPEQRAWRIASAQLRETGP